MIGAHIVGNNGITYVDNDAAWNSGGRYGYSPDIDNDNTALNVSSNGNADSFHHSSYVDWGSCGRNALRGPISTTVHMMWMMKDTSAASTAMFMIPAGRNKK